MTYSLPPKLIFTLDYQNSVGEFYDNHTSKWTTKRLNRNSPARFWEWKVINGILMERRVGFTSHLGTSSVFDVWRPAPTAIASAFNSWVTSLVIEESGE